MIQLELNGSNRADNGAERSACFSTGTYYGSMRDTGAYGLFVQANELASLGVSKASVEVRISIPAEMDKSRINSVRNHMKRAAKKLSEEGFIIEDIQIRGGIQTAIRVPAVRIMAAGTANRKEGIESASFNAGDGRDILLTGWIGLEGMLRIIGEREHELRDRFTPTFIRQMKAFDSEICGLGKIRAAQDAEIFLVRQITEGGILAALWRLSEETGMGMSLDMKKISIRQETIEVCEHFRLNPYQLTSGGSFLMLAEHGEAAAEKLRQKGIAAVVIGRLTDGNDKVMHNGEDVRYIDRPGADELMKVF
ncbi:MAG: hypothetical protein HFH13_05115 [Dorea sp.]|jgi:hydrogenase expression/formation protein HypE|nr:hypothetical protein [Dorea sp.]